MDSKTIGWLVLGGVAVWYFMRAQAETIGTGLAMSAGQARAKPQTALPDGMAASASTLQAQQATRAEAPTEVDWAGLINTGAGLVSQFATQPRTTVK